MMIEQNRFNRRPPPREERQATEESHNTSVRTYTGGMSCLSPIQEYSQYPIDSFGSHTSRSSHASSAHRRNLSAYSSLGALRAEQKLLQSKNQNTRFTIGGDVRRECVMTAIPESQHAQRMKGPTAADMKLLGLTMPDIEDSTALDNDSYDGREEDTRNKISSDQRTQASFERHDPVFNENEDEEDSLGLPKVVSSTDFDDVSEMASQLRGASDSCIALNNKSAKGKIKIRGIEVKKTFKRIAKKALRKLKPFICKTRSVFEKKKPPELKRAKGHLT